VEFNGQLLNNRIGINSWTTYPIHTIVEYKHILQWTPLIWTPLGPKMGPD